MILKKLYNEFKADLITPYDRTDTNALSSSLLSGWGLYYLSFPILFVLFITYNAYLDHGVYYAVASMVMSSAAIATVLFIYEYFFLEIQLAAMSAFPFIYFKEEPLPLWGKVAAVLSVIVLPYMLTKYVITLKFNLEKRAYFFLLLSFGCIVAALSMHPGAQWAQWWTQSVPLVFPGTDWAVPWTESLGVPFALVGLLNSPISSTLEAANSARGMVFGLYILAGLLFFYARSCFNESGATIKPGLGLFTFALFCSSIYIEVFSHAKGVDALDNFLIIFIRAFALMVLLVTLFWREKALSSADHVLGAQGLIYQARANAEKKARLIGWQILLLVWVCTNLTHVFSNGLPELVIKILCIAAAVPVGHALYFMHKYKTDPHYQQYLQAREIARHAPNLPPTDASPEEIDRGLKGRSGNDRPRFDDDGN